MACMARLSPSLPECILSVVRQAAAWTAFLSVASTQPDSPAIFSDTQAARGTELKVVGGLSPQTQGGRQSYTEGARGRSGAVLVMGGEGCNGRPQGVDACRPVRRLHTFYQCVR